MAQVQEIWNKFNPRERLTGIGALIVLLAWIFGIIGRGLGIGSLGLLGAIAVLVVLYLKYANPDIKWPVHVALITLAISAIVALAALLTLLDYFSIHRRSRHQRPALTRPVCHRRAADGVGGVAGVPGGEAGVAQHVGQLGLNGSARGHPHRATPRSPARGAGRSGRGAGWSRRRPRAARAATRPNDLLARSHGPGGAHRPVSSCLPG